MLGPLCQRLVFHDKMLVVQISSKEPLGCIGNVACVNLVKFVPNFGPCNPFLGKLG